MVNINWYPGHMAKTKRLISEQINLIDIVYEVIDARMPLSSKIIDIEEYTKNKPKILIISKMDLCDEKETERCRNYENNKKGADRKQGDWRRQSNPDSVYDEYEDTRCGGYSCADSEIDGGGL